MANPSISTSQSMKTTCLQKLFVWKRWARIEVTETTSRQFPDLTNKSTFLEKAVQYPSSHLGWIQEEDLHVGTLQKNVHRKHPIARVNLNHFTHPLSFAMGKLRPWELLWLLKSHGKAWQGQNYEPCYLIQIWVLFSKLHTVTASRMTSPSVDFPRINYLKKKAFSWNLTLPFSASQLLPQTQT